MAPRPRPRPETRPDRLPAGKDPGPGRPQTAPLAALFPAPRPPFAGRELVIYNANRKTGVSFKATQSAGSTDIQTPPLEAGASPAPDAAGDAPELRKTSLVKTAINTYLEEGMTDKNALYTKVVSELGVPRPSVRRIARDMRLRDELLDKVNVLRPAVEARAGAQA